jgi:hypothetical protein
MSNGFAGFEPENMTLNHRLTNKLCIGMTVPGNNNSGNLPVVFLSKISQRKLKTVYIIC